MKISNNDYAFTTSGLSKSYGYIHAVNDVSINVKKGSIGLLGPNGAGKSTLIKTVLGLIRPTDGSYTILGIPEGGLHLDEIGYMPEHDCLPPDFTAVGFVSYMGKLCGLPAHVAMERTHEVLDFIGMDEARYRKIKSFSTGMKQKVKLAQALVHDPGLLFFDEPTNGLDPDGRMEMLDLIRDVSSAGKTVILSTHLLPDVEYVCDDVIIMNNGNLILYDTLDRVLGKKHVVLRLKGDRKRFVEALSSKGYQVSTDSGNILVEGEVSSNDVFESAIASNAQIRYFSHHSNSLEDIFLKMVGDDNE